MTIIKAALLDLDGLLLDTEPLQFAAWRDVAEEEGMILSVEACKRFVGVNSLRMAEHILKNTSSRATPIELAARKTERFLHHVRGVKPMPGAKELLTKLRKNHLHLSVVSGSARVEVVQALQFTGLFSFFDAIITGDDVKKPKPAADCYLLAVRSLKVLARECVAFEDSETGLAAAKSAGIYCVAIPNVMSQNQNFSKADLIVKSIPSLLHPSSSSSKTKNPIIAKLFGEQ